ncbi:MAG: OmpA family protein, partial [Candidatus Cloacimonadota bacterium]
YYSEKDTFSIISDSTTERVYALRMIEKIGTFKGKIVDAETEKPLGATITFKDMSIASDSLSGEFNVKLEEGSYTVGITKKRYSPLGDTFLIKADSITERLYKLMKIKVKVITFMDVIFDFDKYFIKKKYYSELDSLADYLKGSEDKIIITLSGHACSIGPAAYNLQLSKKRVRSVKNYLIKKGISGKRLNIEYFGESRPKHDNKTDVGRIKNRRVEIIQEENGK